MDRFEAVLDVRDARLPVFAVLFARNVRQFPNICATSGPDPAGLLTDDSGQV